MLDKVKSLLRTALLIIALLISLSLIKSILKIAGSNQKITDEEVKVEELQKENEKLNQNLASIKSPQFVEQEARDTLGLAKKGEIVVVLPDDNSLKALAPKKEELTFSLPDPIWKLWAKLFL